MHVHLCHHLNVIRVGDPSPLPSVTHTDPFITAVSHDSAAAAHAHTRAYMHTDAVLLSHLSVSNDNVKRIYDCTGRVWPITSLLCATLIYRYMYCRIPQTRRGIRTQGGPTSRQAQSSYTSIDHKKKKEHDWLRGDLVGCRQCLMMGEQNKWLP